MAETAKFDYKQLRTDPVRTEIREAARKKIWKEVGSYKYDPDEWKDATNDVKCNVSLAYLEWLGEKHATVFTPDKIRNIKDRLWIRGSTDADAIVARINQFLGDNGLYQDGIIWGRLIEKLEELTGPDFSKPLRKYKNLVSAVVPTETPVEEPTVEEPTEVVDPAKEEGTKEYIAAMGKLIDRVKAYDRGTKEGIKDGSTSFAISDPSEQHIMTPQFDDKLDFVGFLNADGIPYNETEGRWETAERTAERKKEEEVMLETNTKTEGTKEYTSAMDRIVNWYKTWAVLSQSEEWADKSIDYTQDPSGNHTGLSTYLEDGKFISVQDKDGNIYHDGSWEAPKARAERIKAEQDAKIAVEKAEKELQARKEKELEGLREVAKGTLSAVGEYTFIDVPLKFDDKNKLFINKSEDADKGKILNLETGEFETKDDRALSLETEEQITKQAELAKKVFESEYTLTPEDKTTLSENPSESLQQNGKFIYKEVDGVVKMLWLDWKWQNTNDQGETYTKFRYANGDTFEGKMKDGIPSEGKYTKKSNGVILDWEFQALGMLKKWTWNMNDGRKIYSESWSSEGWLSWEVTFTIPWWLTFKDEYTYDNPDWPKSIVAVQVFLEKYPETHYDPDTSTPFDRKYFKNLQLDAFLKQWTPKTSVDMKEVDALKDALKPLSAQTSLQKKTLKEISEMW
jgi:hypothetical protein